jgi:HEAT repeat protein
MGGEAIPELGRLLENKETSSIAKQTAATLIGDIGRADDLGSVALESAIPILASSLSNSDSSVRQAAASALGDFGPLAEIALPALSQTLLGQDVSVNQAVASTLLKIGPQSVPALSEALRSDNTLTRLYAADALWTLTENRDLVLPTLVAAAASNDFQTRELATLGIAYLGRQALPAVPFLNRLLGNSDSRTRNIARTALEIVGNNNRPSSNLGILEDQPRGLNAVPAVVEAITRLWR